MSSGSNYSFPRLDVPKSEKNQKYHEDFARAIVNRSVDDTWRNSWLLISECYKFLEDGSNGELVSHLQKADDNSDLPALWLSLNSIRTKVDVLVGEMEARGYEIRVRALSKEAVVRKHEEKERLRVKRKLQPLFSTADAEADIPTGNTEYVPQTDQELNEYADLSFKDKFELIMTGALRWLAARNNWDEERKTLLTDVIASGRTWTKSEIIRGLPRARRVHPLNMIFDTSSKKDDLSDSTFFGEIEYLSLASAAERFNLSSEELEKVYNAHQEHQGTNPANEAVSSAAPYAYSFNTIGGNRLLWFKTIGSELRVLVARAVWRDFEVINYKDETNPKYGTEHFQKIPDTETPKSGKSVSRKIEIWRQCTIVGGHIIREWGECPNQVRNLSDLGTTEPPYQSWIPDYSSGRGVSKVERLASIQLYKDILMYNLQNAVIQAGAKGITYDLAMKPDNMTIEEVMKYLKVFGISFFNSKDFQMYGGNSSSPFKEYDLSITDSIVRYIEIMKYLDSEMDSISGVSGERQGMLQGASQGLGVTQTALAQQNLVTAPLFKGFERFCSRVQMHQAKLVKIAWSGGKELFAPIIGDVGVDFLRDNVDLELEDFGVVVESIPPMLQDRAKFEQLIMFVVQSNPDFIDDALAILLEPDLKVAVRKFQRKRTLQKIFMQKQAEAQQQQQMALDERMKQLDVQQQDKEIEGNLEETRMKNDAGLQKTFLTGRTKLSGDKIKMMGQVLQNNNKQANERRQKTTS